MLMKERRSNNMQSKEDFIEMRVPASAEYVSLIRLTLSGVFREVVLHMMILKMPRLQLVKL